MSQNINVASINNRKYSLNSIKSFHILLVMNMLFPNFVQFRFFAEEVSKGRFDTLSFSQYFELKVFQIHTKACLNIRL